MWDRDPTIIEPSMASYTDTYYIPNPENPGTHKEPNMLEVKIGEKVVMYNPYGSLLAYCVKKRQITETTSLSGSVDPSEFGVKFDMNLGKCIFTRDFCDRYGMEYVESDNDCKLRPGQEVAELIFGPTLTRGTIRTYQEKVSRVTVRVRVRVTLKVRVRATLTVRARVTVMVRMRATLTVRVRVMRR